MISFNLYQWLLQNFAHAPMAVSSGHVRQIVQIWCLETKLQRNIIFIRFKFSMAKSPVEWFLWLKVDSLVKMISLSPTSPLTTLTQIGFGIQPSCMWWRNHDIFPTNYRGEKLVMTCFDIGPGESLQINKKIVVTIPIWCPVFKVDVVL